MNLIVRLAPRGQQSDYEDLAAIEDFGPAADDPARSAGRGVRNPPDASGGRTDRLSRWGDAGSEGWPMRLIPLLAARACYRLSMRLALLGKRISGI